MLMVTCAAALGGCSDNTAVFPLAPSAIVSGDGAVTLKASAPTPLAASIEQERVTGTVTVTVSVRNVTGAWLPTAANYRFQVLSDAGTRQIEEGVVEAGSTITTYRVRTQLSPATRYRWRARVEIEVIGGPWSAWGRFTTPARPEAQVTVLEPPVLLDPIGGETVETPRPRFLVRNGAIEHPNGHVLYEFQLDTSPDFNLPQVIETTRTGGEPTAGGHTSVVFHEDLKADERYLWRVRARDTQTRGAWSEVGEFETIPAFETPLPEEPAPETPSL